MPRKREQSISDLGAIFGNGLLKAVTRPDANGYRPHAKQEIFHGSEARGRLYIGGNRSGKSVGGILEDIWWLTGRHQYRETPPPPVRGRLVCVDFPNGWEKIIRPILQQWIPPSELIDCSWDASWNSRTKTLNLDNGSFLEIMSYEQDTDNFAGSSRHFIHYDEEPPRTIFNECRMRLIDTAGSWWITMTPVEGMTWVYDDIYEASKIDKNIEVIEVDISENPYLSSVEIEAALSGLDTQERAAREHGKFVQVGGLIFKHFNPDVHVIPALKQGFFPLGSIVIGSIDHGYNNPTSVHWHLVLPNGTVITFAEHYKSEMTINQHAARIKAKVSEMQYMDPILYYADPAMKQRSAVNGNSVIREYQKLGIQLVPSNNDVKIGIARMLNYENANRWFITEACPNLIREKRRYRWKTNNSKKLQERHGNYDEPHKKDDHAVDDARYFFMSRPELTPDVKKLDNPEARANIQAILKGQIGVNVYTGRRDHMLNLQPDYDKYKVSTDEYMGGEW